MKFKKILMGAMFSLLCIPALSSCGLFGEDGALTDKTVHIKTKEDLTKIKIEGNYVLDNDIDCEGLYMRSLYKGGQSGYYTFTLDGNGHTIKNLSVLASIHGNTAGFISFCHEGVFTFQNINFENYKLHYDNVVDNLFAGSLIGLTNGEVNISNVRVNGELDMHINNSMSCDVGGLVGYGEKINLNSAISDVDINMHTNDFQSGSFGLCYGRAYQAYIKNFLGLGSMHFFRDDTYNYKLSGVDISLVGFPKNEASLINAILAPRYITFDESYNPNSLNFVNFEFFPHLQYNTRQQSFACLYKGESTDPNEIKYFRDPNSCVGAAVNLKRSEILSKRFMFKGMEYQDPTRDYKDYSSNAYFSDEYYTYGHYEGDKFIEPNFKMFVEGK